ncbi:MAG: hypothetical protein ACI4T1_01550 [Christensenellales bacterium]
MEISIKAGEIVGVLYDAILKQYKEKDEELKSLNELCVRLIFCLYVEDIVRRKTCISQPSSKVCN